MRKLFLLSLFTTALCFINNSQAQEIIYSNSLSTQAKFDEMSVLDNNNDSKTWGFTSGYAQYNFSTSNADDYLFTPEVHLIKGKNYQIKFSIASYNASNVEKMKVKIGREKTAESQTGLIYDNPNINNSFFSSATATFTVEEDGAYYLSFYAYSDRNKWYLKLKDIELAMLVNLPAAVENFIVIPDEDKSLKATLSWDNPTKDTAGNDLNQEDFTKIEIYRNDDENPVYTLENPILGASENWVDESVAESGNYTYTITPINGTAKGQSISYSAWIGDALQLPYINNFTESEFSDLLVVDARTWAWKSNGRVEYKWYSKPDDWLITPKIEMKENKQYLIKLKDSNVGGRLYMTKQFLRLTFGSTSDISSHSIEAANITVESSTFSVERNVVYTSSETGDFCAGIHLFHPSSGEYTYLHSFSIHEFAPTLSEPIVDEETKEVALSWTAPSYPDATYTIYRNEERIAENIKQTSFVDKDPIYTESNIYQVAIAYEDDKESDRSNAVEVDFISTALNTKSLSSLKLSKHDSKLSIETTDTIEKIDIYSIDGHKLASATNSNDIVVGTDIKGIVILKVTTKQGTVGMKTVL